MNSDGDKLYTKLVTFNEIYVIQTFFIWNHLKAKKRYIVQLSVFGIQIWYINYFAPTAMRYDCCSIVLLNFEIVVYFRKMKKKSLALHRTHYIRSGLRTMLGRIQQKYQSMAQTDAQHHHHYSRSSPRWTSWCTALGKKSSNIWEQSWHGF
jgi:hypothetical protein